MSEPVTGRCACGAIHYRITTRIRQAVNCHCSMCRRHNGAAFTSYAVLPGKYFELLDNRHKLTDYGFSERVHKHFCSICGTPLFNTNTRFPDYRMVFLGTLDQAGEVTPNANIFCSSQLGWVREIDAIPNFDEAFGD